MLGYADVVVSDLSSGTEDLMGQDNSKVMPKPEISDQLEGLAVEDLKQNGASADEVNSELRKVGQLKDQEHMAPCAWKTRLL